MRVLIVSGSPTLRGVLTQRLQQAGNGLLAIAEASNGIEALGMIMAAPPAVVMADWHMPHMSGISLLQALKAANLALVCGIATAESNDEMRQLAAEAGARFYVTKPFAVAALQTALAGLLPDQLPADPATP